MKNFICTLVMCLLGGMLLADTCVASICDTKETVIFFGNGIKTVEKKAYNSRDIIKRRLEAVLTPEEYELLSFKLSYNETSGNIRDLLESTIQSLTLDASRFWRILWGREIMPDWFADKLLLLSTTLDYSALVTTDSLQDHVKSYQNAIDEGKKVILVAHSQGNFFGNQAYNFLTIGERRSFSMVSVANPDSYVLDDNSPAAPYTSLVNDKVIQAITTAQLLLPTKPMEPNTVNLTESDDPLQHKFIETYMVAGSDSNAGIMVDIVMALDSLITPPQVVKPGVITASLTWGEAPDIDLHVNEPNGAHVYFLNLQGISGALDIDDRYRRGPEHYHVPTCDTVEEGIYRIGLDYYYGSEPEIATVQIQAGLLVRTFQIPMSSSYYGSEFYPELVANIRVQKDENGDFEFEIYE